MILAAGLLIVNFDFIPSQEVYSADSLERQIIEEQVEEAPQYELLGDFKITHYCSCPICCGTWGENRPKDANGKEIVYTASGAVAEPGKTIAVDPEVIPLGSAVIINGQEYIAHDVGGAIKGARIDVYCGSHEEALSKGVAIAQVFTEI